MNEKALRILEYPKIREMLVACAGSFPGRQKCQALLPSQDLQEVQRMQTETADALRRIYEKGSVSLFRCEGHACRHCKASDRREPEYHRACWTSQSFWRPQPG